VRREDSHGEAQGRRRDIGAGTADLAAFRRVREHTERLVLIEVGPHGTTCAGVGWMRSKLLLSVRAVRLARAVLGAAALVALAAPLRAGVALTDEHFDDPFVYCAAVGTIDAPDARYTGPALPEAVARGLQAALDLPAAAPLEPLLRNAIWRCMDGKVYACTIGANLPCAEKADTRTAPSAAVREFCQENPGADVIPMAVSGRATVFEWRCADARPTIVRQLAQPDAAGYLANIWYPIERATP
jgi:hypothetical protein